MKTLVFILSLGVLSLVLMGCPKKRTIPEPMPPEPQVYNWEDVPTSFGGAPPVGLRVYFRRMMADYETRKFGPLSYFTVPLYIYAMPPVKEMYSQSKYEPLSFIILMNSSRQGKAAEDFCKYS